MDNLSTRFLSNLQWYTNVYNQFKNKNHSLGNMLKTTVDSVVNGFWPRTSVIWDYKSPDEIVSLGELVSTLLKGKANLSKKTLIYDSDIIEEFCQAQSSSSGKFITTSDILRLENIINIQKNVVYFVLSSGAIVVIEKVKTINEFTFFEGKYYGLIKSPDGRRNYNSTLDYPITIDSKLDCYRSDNPEKKLELLDGIRAVSIYRCLFPNLISNAVDYTTCDHSSSFFSVFQSVDNLSGKGFDWTSRKFYEETKKVNYLPLKTKTAQEYLNETFPDNPYYKNDAKSIEFCYREFVKRMEPYYQDYISGKKDAVSFIDALTYLPPSYLFFFMNNRHLFFKEGSRVFVKQMDYNRDNFYLMVRGSLINKEHHIAVMTKVINGISGNKSGEYRYLACKEQIKSHILTTTSNVSVYHITIDLTIDNLQTQFSKLEMIIPEWLKRNQYRGVRFKQPERI